MPKPRKALVSLDAPPLLPLRFPPFQVRFSLWPRLRQYGHRLTRGPHHLIDPEGSQSFVNAINQNEHFTSVQISPSLSITALGVPARSLLATG